MRIIIQLVAFFVLIWYGVNYLFKKFFSSSSATREEGDITIQRTKKQQHSGHKKNVGEYVDYEEIK